VVSGLPRSGTSLMMQMLAAGGMPILTDGARAADQHNPRGYFELEAVKCTATDQTWLDMASGKAVKVIHLLLRDLPPRFEYRVLLMRRDMNEVLASQRAMLEPLGRTGAALSDDSLAAIYVSQLQCIKEWMLARPWFRVLEVDYAACVYRAAQTAARVSEFLELPLDCNAMAKAVDPSLHRQRG